MVISVDLYSVPGVAGNPRIYLKTWVILFRTRNEVHLDESLCHWVCGDLMAEKGGSRTLRESYGSQPGFEDQRHHRAPSFSEA